MRTKWEADISHRIKNVLPALCVGVLFIMAPREAEGRRIIPREMNAPLDEVRRLASKGDTTAIFILGLRSDRGSIPILEKIASNPTPPDKDPYRTEDWRVGQFRQSSLAAKAALSRMHVRDYFHEFIIELSTSNPIWKKDVMECLGYSGDKRAIKYLGALLEDDSCVEPRSPCNTFSSVAAESLSEILDPPFKEVHKERPGMPFAQYKEWKQWWKANKGKYK